jgi:HSP20 family molecular chaperone IbpA
MAVNIQRTESTEIARELERLNEAISRRAYELYEENHLPSVLDNWITAERQLVERPLVELHEEGSAVEVLVGMDGVEPDDIEVHVASQDLLIRAHRQLQDLARTLDSADVVGVVHLPDAIDPETVNAEFEDGRLRLRMSVAQ